MLHSTSGPSRALLVKSLVVSSDGRLQLLLENLCLVGGKLLLSCKSESLLKPLDRPVVESAVVGDLSDKVCVPRLQKLAGCSTNVG